MKKVWGFLFYITAMLCLYVLIGHSSIVSKAATEYKKTPTGILMDGEVFRKE